MGSKEELSVVLDEVSFVRFLALRYADGVVPGQGSPDQTDDNDDDDDDISPPPSQATKYDFHLALDLGRL